MSNHPQESIRQRPKGRPALIVGVVLVALVIALTACGGGDSEEGASPMPIATASTAATSTPTPTPSGPLPEVTDVAPDLDFFGELAAVNSHPVTATFDSSAKSLSLADGASVEVPAGAFPAPTELSVAIIDLLLENYLINPPEARIYVLSTEDDVVLGAPLVLEVPKPADSVNVTRLVDGEWLPVEVPAGPTTRIEITHFSNDITLVGDKPSGDEAPLFDVPRVVINSPGAFFLKDCVKAIYGYFNDINFVVIQIAVSACSQGLAGSGLLEVGEGDEVNALCVSDRMREGKSSDQALDECTPEQKDDPEPSESAAPQPEPDPDPDPAPASKITGTLAPGIASSSATADRCVERFDFDAIFCDYTFNVTMDYVVSGLPANVICTFPDQSSDFFALDSGNRLDLSSLDGLVSRAPVAVAVFDRSGNPNFSNPVSVECTLSTPIEGEEFSFRRLDDFTFAFDLPNVAEVHACLPFDHPDCSAP